MTSSWKSPDANSFGHVLVAPLLIGGALVERRPRRLVADERELDVVQPAATVNVTLAVEPVTPIWLADETIALADGHVDGGGEVHVPLLSFTSRACEGASPLPQFATSCTLSQTTSRRPGRERAAERRSRCPLPNRPRAISRQLAPWSVDAYTRTSAFVRDRVVASEPFHASAVKDALPWQSMLPRISE